MRKLIRGFAYLLVFLGGAWLMDCAMSFPPHGFFYLACGVMAVSWGGVHMIFASADHLGGSK